MNKFYGQFAPPVDRFILERYFPECGIQGIFVECGAFDGLLESSCKFFEETMGWKGFNLEPVPWIFESLTKNRPLSKNLNIGLSNINGDVLFKQAISPLLGRDFGNGSICHAPAHLQSLEDSGCTFKDINISVITWRDFVTEQKIKHVDLFVLDVEGHELSVIDGMHGSKVLPNIICVEFGHIGIDVLRDHLEELSYVYDITSNGNAYFVRKDLLGLFALRRAVRFPTNEIISKTHSTAFKKAPLAFVHIPKCSGTSFENYLTTSQQFVGRCNCFTGIDTTGNAENLSTYLKCNKFSPFVFGHIPYALYERYIPDALFATFLRDPVQRSISHYKSWHDPKNFHPDDPHYIASTQDIKDALLFAQKATLTEFIKADNSTIRAGGALGNIQTTMLSSYENVSLDMHLESAKKNLANFVFFGLTEKFEESIKVFRSIFLDAPPYELNPIHENRSRFEVNDISSEIMDLIGQQVSYDILLYDYAKTLFEERKHSQFLPKETFLLADLCQNRDANQLEEENKNLRQQLLDSAATHKELQRIYSNIIQSKGWRLVEVIRSIKKRLQ